MLIQNTNPAVVAPDSNRVRRGLAARRPVRLRARAVHDRDGAARRRRAAGDDVPGARRPLRRRRPHASCRSARSWSSRRASAAPTTRCCRAWPRGSAREHPGFDMTRDGDGGRDAARLRLARRRRDGGSRAGSTPATSFERSHFLDGFGFPDGRFRFAPDWAALGPHSAGMPRAAGPLGGDRRARPTDRPFRLVAAPARNFLNTSFTETPDQPQARGPADGAAAPGRRGPAGRGRGRAGARSATRRARWWCTRGSSTACSPAWSWSRASGRTRDFARRHGHQRADQRRRRPRPNGGAVFHDTAVWMRALEAVQQLAAE